MTLENLPTEVIEKILTNVPQQILRNVWLQMDDRNPLKQVVASNIAINFPCWPDDNGSIFDEIVMLFEVISVTRVKSLRVETEFLSQDDFSQFLGLCKRKMKPFSSIQTIEFQGTTDRYRQFASVLPIAAITALKLKVSSILEPEHIPPNLRTISLNFLEENSADFQVKNLPGSVSFLEIVGAPKPHQIELPNGIQKLRCIGMVEFWHELPPSIVTLRIFLSIFHLTQVKLPENLVTLGLHVENLSNSDLMGVQWPKKMRTLRIVGGHISSLSNVAFPESIATLQVLAGLATLQDAVFPPFLEELYLDLNEIELLGGPSFPDLLKRLALGFNLIKLIDKANLPIGLRNLDLGYNKILNLYQTTFPSLIEQLDLTHNAIETLSGTMLPSLLKILVLSHNKIRNLENWTLPSNLEELALDNNEFVEFADVDLPNLKNLCLDYEGDQWNQAQEGSLRKLSKCKLPASLDYLLVKNQPVEDWSQVAFPDEMKFLRLQLMEDPALLNLPLSLESLHLKFPPDSDSMYADLQLPHDLLALSLENGISYEFDWGLPSIVKFSALNFTGAIEVPESAQETSVYARENTAGSEFSTYGY